LYVYGIVNAASATSLSDELQLVTEGGLTAVVGLVPADDFETERLREHLRDLEWVKRLAVAHSEVLDRVAAATAVVPMRICTVYRSESRVREMLRDGAVRFSELLAQLTGRSEWGVKVFSVRPPSIPEPEAEAPQLGGAGAAYLLARRRERDVLAQADRQIDQACEEIHELLCAAAVQGAVNPPQRQTPGEMLLNGVYLVDDQAVEPFREQVRELGQRYESFGLELVATGPWPAYNFVPEDVATAS
jgi:hypothetical protein